MFNYQKSSKASKFLNTVLLDDDDDDDDECTRIPCSLLLEEHSGCGGGESDPWVALVDVDANVIEISRDEESDEGCEEDDSKAADGCGSVSTFHTEGVGHSGKGHSGLTEELGGKGLELGSLWEAPGLEGGLRGDAALARGQANVDQKVLEDGSSVVSPTEEGLGEKELDTEVGHLHGDVDTELLGDAVEEALDRAEHTRDKSISNCREGGNIREDGAVENNGGSSLVASHVCLKEGADAVGEVAVVELVNRLGREVVQGTLCNTGAGVDFVDATSANGEGFLGYGGDGHRRANKGKGGKDEDGELERHVGVDYDCCFGNFVLLFCGPRNIAKCTDVC